MIFPPPCRLKIYPSRNVSVISFGYTSVASPNVAETKSNSIRTNIRVFPSYTVNSKPKIPFIIQEPRLVSQSPRCEPNVLPFMHITAASIPLHTDQNTLH